MVRANGAGSKTTSGKRIIGVDVASICKNRKNRVARMQILKRRPIPIRHSIVASMYTAAAAGKLPNVTISVVRSINPIVGLKLGKNLRAPNQIKIKLRLTRKYVTLYLAIQLVIAVSILSKGLDSFFIAAYLSG